MNAEQRHLGKLRRLLIRSSLVIETFAIAAASEKKPKMQDYQRAHDLLREIWDTAGVPGNSRIVLISDGLYGPSLAEQLTKRGEKR